MISRVRFGVMVSNNLPIYGGRREGLPMLMEKESMLVCALHFRMGRVPKTCRWKIE